MARFMSARHPFASDRRDSKRPPTIVYFSEGLQGVIGPISQAERIPTWNLLSQL